MAIRRAFRAVTFHADFEALGAEWSAYDLDLVVVGEREPRNRGDYQLLSSDGAYRLSPWCNLHLIVFGEPPVIDVRIHHGVEVRVSKRARSSEFAVQVRHGPVASMLHGSLRDVEDVRGWATLALAPPPPRTGNDNETAVLRVDWERARALFRSSFLATACVPEAPLAINTVCEDSGKGIAWLPNVLHDGDRVAWIEALTQEWAEVDRKGFATILPWRERVEWMSDREVALSAAVKEIEHRRRETLAQLQAEQDAVEVQLTVARRDADGFERALLAGKGEELVGVVAKALSRLGFVVVNMDAARKEGEPKLEDLRLRLPDRPGWVTLVEVKGHDKRGFRLEDMNQARRPRDRYRDAENRWPDLVMVVHNGQAADPPDTRRRPFEASPDDLRAVEEEGFWLVVPTVDLFRLLRDREALGTAAARLLAEARGVFSYPSRA